ncbi:hypothetical protein QGN23_09505 [Chryseobacterium gotjawalense]|uniref:Uncharacterized protein n=1 Tax=Chryseobacterium gotjawalense TaxID=3042315 RepID=A0ABY8RAF4_9FLAO|nr:hypothetical protein [Chryseobacterium sp. wdc7]WHF50674.1 hypothetical protein QGN23_09505 [Chryseobacterium sp. wdc7]
MKPARIVRVKYNWKSSPKSSGLGTLNLEVSLTVFLFIFIKIKEDRSRKTVKLRHKENPLL